MKKGLLLLAGITLFSCSVQVKTLQRPNTDLGQHSSWCWLEGCEVTYQGPDQYYNKKAMDEISNAIAFNMQEKGYTQGDENSDLLVNFVLVLEEDSVQLDSDFPMGGEVREIEQSWLLSFYPEYYYFLSGSLVIDVIDRRRSELVWRSHATRYLEINPEPDKGEIWKGVAKAMKKFPDKTKE